MDESIIKQLVSSIKCGSCGQHYQPDGVEILERKDDLWFLQVYCASCHVGCFVAAIIQEEGAPEMVTDLTEAELEQFQELERVTEDDLLEMHAFLKEFRGGPRQLF